MTPSSVIAKLTIYNNQMMIKQRQKVSANFQIFEIWSTKIVVAHLAGGILSLRARVQDVRIFSPCDGDNGVLRWWLSLSLQIVGLPCCLGDQERDTFALQCSADAATIAATNIFATISVLQYCCCCYKYCSCYLNAAATDMWLPKEMPLLCLW